MVGHGREMPFSIAYVQQAWMPYDVTRLPGGIVPELRGEGS